MRMQMTPEQRSIRAQLNRLSPSLADLYEGAVFLISKPGFPGKVRLVAHAVREIRNRLPDAVFGRTEICYVEYPKIVEEIRREAERSGLIGVRVAACDTDKQSPLTISRNLWSMIHNLLRRHAEVRESQKDRAAKLMVAFDPDFEGATEMLNPIAKLWVEESRWFVGRAHRDCVTTQDDEEELALRFGRFEGTIRNLLGHFYAGLQVIDDILSEANADDKEPSEAAVEQAISLLTGPQYYLHFFRELANPHWLPLLEVRGLVPQTPEPPEDPSGIMTYSRWAQGDYLKRIAPKLPDDVLRIIKGISTRNPLVKMQCVECLLALPLEVAARGTEVACGLLNKHDGEDNWEV